MCHIIFALCLHFCDIPISHIFHIFGQVASGALFRKSDFTKNAEHIRKKARVAHDQLVTWLVAAHPRPILGQSEVYSL